MRSIYSLLFLLITLVVSSCSEKGTTPREQSFDEEWLFHRGDIPEGEKSDLDDSQWCQVNLPHDWSIENIPGTNSPFIADAVTEVSGGFTVGGTGWYRKHFHVDEAEKGKCIAVAFDGIYMNADIWVNDNHVANHVYGYTAFELDITDYVRFGAENLIAVRVKNEGLNCRWYTGSGIYRHTSLKITDPLHFETWETFVTAPIATVDRAEVHVQSVLANTEKATGKVIWETQIVDKENRTVDRKEQQVTLDNEEKIKISHLLEVASPQLWSTDNPYLYTVVNRLLQDNKIIDEERISIGIRNITFSAEKGFQLNGKSMKLKGGCIHHDNGLLGAKAFDRAEERKVELLKAAGFNALRLSHNPPSTALLNACDRLGMLVIDEAFDMWRYGHYKGDYGDYFDDRWQSDMYSMVARDRNHPCVIMWSIGNEIKDKETAEVVDICRELADFVKALDTTRPVTAGVNSVVDATDDFLNTLDVCGYNYCLNRYESDAKRYPERIIYASESYASQAYDYWKGVEQHPWVIGDFIWTAFDYIGEASIGWCGYPLDKRIFPWNHAYCGDLNLSGERRPQSYLRETLWSENSVSYIVVTPPVPSFPLNPDKADWSVWDFPDVVDHWNFPGYEGKELAVSVYSNCEQVELFLNGDSFGKQINTADKKHVLTWKVPYTFGVLKAISYDKNGEMHTTTLESAGKVEKIHLSADRTDIVADGNDLSYVTLELVDAKGIRNQQAEELVEFSIEGDATIEGVGNANPMSTESFVANSRKTWRGSNLLVVRSGKSSGRIIVTAKVQGLPVASITINQKD